MNKEKPVEQTKKCRKCKEEVLKEAKKCKHCGADLRNWYMRHKIISAALFLFILIFDIILPASIPANNQQPSANTPVNLKEIVVTNQAVKKVDGKCRYFFLVENKDQTSFSGSVLIKVQNPMTTLGQETFTTTQPIEPGIGKVVYIDTHTCPPSLHGAEDGMSKFEYEAKENDQVVKNGSGGIIDNVIE